MASVSREGHGCCVLALREKRGPQAKLGKLQHAGAWRMPQLRARSPHVLGSARRDKQCWGEGGGNCRLNSGDAELSRPPGIFKPVFWLHSNKEVLVERRALCAHVRLWLE